jgi:hypothetical protein
LTEGRIDYHRLKKMEILLQDRSKQRFLALEEVVKAPRVDSGVGQEIDHAGLGKSPLPEKVARRIK